MKKFSKIFTLVLAVVLVFCVVCVVATANTDAVDMSGVVGRTFSGTEELSMTNVLTA